MCESSAWPPRVMPFLMGGFAAVLVSSALPVSGGRRAEPGCNQKLLRPDSWQTPAAFASPVNDAAVPGCNTAASPQTPRRRCLGLARLRWRHLQSFFQPNPPHLLLVHAIPQFHELVRDILVARRRMRLGHPHNLHLLLLIPFWQRLGLIAKGAAADVQPPAQGSPGTRQPRLHFGSNFPLSLRA